MLHARRFQNDSELSLFLRGGLPLRPLPNRGFLPIVGMTLTLSHPSASLTFAAGADAQGLTVQEFVNQVDGGFSDLVKVEQQGGILYLVEKNPKEGIGLDSSVQPVRAYLGLGSGEIRTRVIHPINGSRAPRLVNVTGGSTGIWVFWEDTMEGSLGPSSTVRFIANPGDEVSPIVLDQVSRGIHVGGSGNLKVRFPGSTSFVTYLSVAAGTYLRIAVDAISHESTATSLVVEY